MSYLGYTFGLFIFICTIFIIISLLQISIFGIYWSSFANKMAISLSLPICLVCSFNPTNPAAANIPAYLKAPPFLIKYNIGVIYKYK